MSKSESCAMKQKQKKQKRRQIRAKDLAKLLIGIGAVLTGLASLIAAIAEISM